MKAAFYVGGDGGIRWWWYRLMAFHGNSNGLRRGDGEAKMVFDTSGSRWRWRASAFDGGDGQQQQRWQRRMTMALDSGGNGHQW